MALIIVQKSTPYYVNFNATVSDDLVLTKRIMLFNTGILIMSSFSKVLSLYLCIDSLSCVKQAKRLHTIGLTFLLLAPTSLGVMNFYWFYKIMSVMYRTLSQKRAP